MASNGRRLVAFCSLLSLLMLFLLLPGQLLAFEFVENGGFEQGKTAWTGSRFPDTTCTPRSGSAAARLEGDSDQVASVRQTVSPIAPGPFAFIAFAMEQSGQAQMRLVLSWRDANGNELLLSETSSAIGAAYAPLQLQATAPSQAAEVAVRVEVAFAAGGIVCLDDISLQGPDPSSVTPTSTSTQTATAELTTIQSPTQTDDAPKGATATRTPTVTRTPTKGPTATTAPSFSFTNGGFEQGLTGWQKFGGELTAPSGEGRTGQRAGVFRSSTDSIKWAFQPVRVDDDEAYEFSGYVRAGPGVRSAYLRISWYTTSDASGRAAATDDSTEATSSSDTGYVYLSTGPIQPPEGANSARVRVMLEPNGADTATIYLDDFAFVTAELAEAAPSTSAPAADESEEEAALFDAPAPYESGSEDDVQHTPPASGPSRASTAATPASTVTVVSEVASARDERPTSTRTPAPRTRLEEATADGKGGDTWVYVALPGALLALGLAFAWSKKSTTS